MTTLWTVVKCGLLLYAICGSVFVFAKAVGDERRRHHCSIPQAIINQYVRNVWKMATECFFDHPVVAVLIGIPVTMAAYVLMHSVLWPLVVWESLLTTPRTDAEAS